MTLFSKINTCSTDNDVTYIIMPRIAQESSIYLFPFISISSSVLALSTISGNIELLGLSFLISCQKLVLSFDFSANFSFIA